MTKEYENYLASRQARNNVLIHYGVKGQKWGTRQWQNADGSYTEAGKHHYGWGYGRHSTGQTPQTYTRSRFRKPPQRVARKPQTRQPTPEEIEARKVRVRKILGIAAGVAVASALTYAAYRKTTKLRDSMRDEVFKRFNTNANDIRTLHSKYWTTTDRKTYSEMTAKRARDVSSSINRRDAVAAKIQDKTGLRINVPQSRAKLLEQRRSEMKYSNFIRDAERRGALNKSVHDARQELRAAERKLNSYQNTAHIGTSKQYESFWNQKYSENVEAARERLNELLLRRRAS